MYDLNDLVQNLSTSRFTFLRTLWSNQWHDISQQSHEYRKLCLWSESHCEDLLSVEDSLSWGQPLFIFCVEVIAPVYCQPEDAQWKDTVCTILHQFCTVQLSIIKSWPLQNAAKTKAVYKTRDPACGSSLRRTWKQRLKQHGCWGF